MRKIDAEIVKITQVKSVREVTFHNTNSLIPSNVSHSVMLRSNDDDTIRFFKREASSLSFIVEDNDRILKCRRGVLQSMDDDGKYSEIHIMCDNVEICMVSDILLEVFNSPSLDMLESKITIRFKDKDYDTNHSLWKECNLIEQRKFEQWNGMSIEKTKARDLWRGLKNKGFIAFEFL